MSELRIVSDDDGNPWIEKKAPDGNWERVEASDDAIDFRLPDIRSLNHSKVADIAGLVEHAQYKFANDILESHNAMAKNLPDALKARFALNPDAGAIPRLDRTPQPMEPAVSAPQSRAFEVPDLPPPAPDPTYELIAKIEDQNVILTEQRDDAREHASATEKDAKWSRGLAWVAIGITLAGVIVQITLSIIELNS